MADGVEEDLVYCITVRGSTLQIEPADETDETLDELAKGVIPSPLILWTYADCLIQDAESIGGIILNIVIHTEDLIRAEGHYYLYGRFFNRGISISLFY